MESLDFVGYTYDWMSGLMPTTTLAGIDKTLKPGFTLQVIDIVNLLV